MLGPENAVWDDGEWIGWHEINQQIQFHEWRVKYPHANRGLIPFFQELLQTAEDYFLQTGRHLQIYGDIGELYGAITYGLKLHSNYAQGSDGRLGNDFVEVKTITPFKNCDQVTVKMTGNFNKLLLVKINECFEVSHKLIARRSLPNRKSKKVKIKWNDY